MVFAKDYETESYLSAALPGAGFDGFPAERPFVVRTPDLMPVLPRRVRRPKILLYSHDTFGLGNIRRTLLLADNFRREYPQSSILIITGSPMIHAFRLPEGIDYIKLPSLDRVDAEKYQPMYLADCAAEIRETRAAIVEKIALGFGPDLFIVDKRAAGIGGELLPALRKLRRLKRDARIVLGIRDILDAPERTSRVLRENGSFETIGDFYDEVWVYGLREVFDTAREYNFPAGVGAKTFYCGYLKRPVTVAPKRSNSHPRVLVTTGGGGDGARMIETYLEGIAARGDAFQAESKVVFGPQMDERTRFRLLETYGGLKNVVFSDFEADLSPDYAAADVVVSMAGYNTVCELLSHRKRAVLVPRAEPVREQLIRARLLAGRGVFDMVEPDALTPDALVDRVLANLAGSGDSAAYPELDGLPLINRRVAALLEDSNA